MEIPIDSALQAVLTEAARRQGVPPEVLALRVLRERFLTTHAIRPQDEWERQLLGLARPCGVSLSDEALGRDEMYE